MSVLTTEQSQNNRHEGFILSARIWYHQHRLRDAVHELDRYRKHRRWLKSQRKRIVAGEQKLRAMPRGTRAKQHCYEQAERAHDRLARQVSPYHLAGDLKYANTRARQLAKLRNKHEVKLSKLIKNR